MFSTLKLAPSNLLIDTEAYMAIIDRKNRVCLFKFNICFAYTPLQQNPNQEQGKSK